MKTFGFNQNYVYDEFGSKRWFKIDDLDIIFDDSNSILLFKDKSGQPFVPPVSKVAVTPILSLLPTIVDIGFRLTNGILENNVKKFTAEYTKHKSNLSAGNGKVPDFSVIREITLDNQQKEKDVALKINFKAIEVVGIKGFCYYVENIELTFSSAKPAKEYKTFDYSIELKTTLLIGGEKKVQELSPIVISSVGFGKTDYDDLEHKLKHRTDIIPFPDGAALTEISIKIVETNPSKVRAEEILSIWNDNKESAKIIINNFLPKKEEEKSIPTQLKYAVSVKFISVLTADMNISPWRAIQWANTLPDIEAELYYTAGITLPFPKNTNDQTHGNKTVIEKITLVNGTANIIELA